MFDNSMTAYRMPHTYCFTEITKVETAYKKMDPPPMFFPTFAGTLHTPTARPEWHQGKIWGL